MCRTVLFVNASMSSLARPRLENLWRQFLHTPTTVDSTFYFAAYMKQNLLITVRHDGQEGVPLVTMALEKALAKITLAEVYHHSSVRLDCWALYEDLNISHQKE